MCAKPLQLGTAALPPARWFAQTATPKTPDAITPVAAMITAACGRCVLTSLIIKCESDEAVQAWQHAAGGHTLTRAVLAIVATATQNPHLVSWSTWVGDDWRQRSCRSSEHESCRDTCVLRPSPHPFRVKQHSHHSSKEDNHLGMAGGTAADSGFPQQRRCAAAKVVASRGAAATTFPPSYQDRARPLCHVAESPMSNARGARPSPPAAG